jgi:hypothetical protein
MRLAVVGFLSLLALTPAAALDFFPFDPAHTGGVNLAVCGRDMFGLAWFVMATASGAPGRVRAYVQEDFTAYLVYDFIPYDASFGGGVSVSCGLMDGFAILMTAPAGGGGPHVRFFGLLPPDFGRE